MVILQQRFHCIFHSDPVAIHVLFNYSTYKTVMKLFWILITLKTFIIHVHVSEKDTQFNTIRRFI